MGEPKTVMLFTRCSAEFRASFHGKAERNGRNVSDVLRELATAWVEGRITIHPHD